jgi:hypothetical protein
MSTIDQYVRSRQIELASSIKERTKIYLDTCFWIKIRQAVCLGKTNSMEMELLNLLQYGVEAGVLICPTSKSTFCEVMKQIDVSSKLTTAKLIDKLSLGICFTRIDSRVAIEIARFLYSRSGKRCDEMQDLVWTKMSYCLGYVHPTIFTLDADLMFECQKNFFEHMWQKNPYEIFEILNDSRLPGDEKLIRSAEKINIGNKAHRHEIKSFEQAYKNEFIGAIDVYGDYIGEAMFRMAENAGIAYPEQDSPEWNKSVRD